MKDAHSERKHSKLSASGSEMWFNCPGSVALSKGMPDKDNKWSLEGTRAHEVLEQILLSKKQNKRTPFSLTRGVPPEMLSHAENAATFMYERHLGKNNSELLVETRIHLSFIHPEMFGTFDGAVVDYFGELDVFDFKYGVGHAVSAGTKEKPNLQMLFYGIGLAHQYGWNFERVRLWIVQPRIKGYDGPTFLELSMRELKAQVEQFERAVERVEKFPKKYAEGSWCHWCKAKGICPLKQEERHRKTKAAFMFS